MLYNLIALIVIVLSLAVIIFLIVKKLPKIRTLDVDTIAEEKEAKVKERILIDRIKRKTNVSKEFFKKGFTPFTSKIKNGFGNAYRKIVDLEKKYRAESNQQGAAGAGSQETIKKVIMEAEDLVKKENYSEAEKKYIEILSLDGKNREVYIGLAEVYVRQKNTKQALQIYSHVLKLDLKTGKKMSKTNEKGEKFETYSNAPDLVEDYIHLGEVNRELGENKKTFENFQKAGALEPNNPKIIDSLVEISIMLKDKKSAWENCKRLEAVNPENQKLFEYKKKISEM